MKRLPDFNGVASTISELLSPEEVIDGGVIRSGMLRYEGIGAVKAVISAIVEGGRLVYVLAISLKSNWRLGSRLGCSPKTFAQLTDAISQEIGQSFSGKPPEGERN